MDVISWTLKWLCLSGVSSLVIIYLYISKKFRYWKNQGIPYMKPLPFIGNLGFIMRKSVFDFFKEMRMKYPSNYVGIFLGWKPAFVIQTPELAKRILVKDTEYFQDRYLYTGYSDPLGSLNLFTVKNPIWSEMRHELSPMFTSSRLKLVTELMNLNAKELVLKVQREYVDSNKPVNLKELFSMYTSDTVAYSVFGLRVSALSGQTSPLWYITNHMVKWTFWRGLEFIMIFFLPYLASLLSSCNISAGTCAILYELADNLMLAQVAVFILGSIETSSTTLSYCLHELAYHTEEQEMLYNEINDALTQKGKDILEYDDLLELKYMSACIYETMRKYPPVPYLDRVCNQEYKLSDEVTIEKGVPVFVNVLALHYDERKYPQPEEWRPERTVPSSDNDNLQFTFLPFGEGPRFCIGKRYGMMQMRAALAQLLHKFKLKPGPVPYYVPADPYSVILAPKHGGCVEFELR